VSSSGADFQRVKNTAKMAVPHVAYTKKFVQSPDPLDHKEVNGKRPGFSTESAIFFGVLRFRER
jgi:hypothetical protein